MELDLIEEEIWAIYEMKEASVLSALEEIASNGNEDHVTHVVQLLEKIAKVERGPSCLSKKMCHQIDGPNKIYQITKGRIRLLWFYDDGRLIICSHVYFKASQKTPKKEINKAIDARNRYLSSKRNDSLVFNTD